MALLQGAKTPDHGLRHIMEKLAPEGVV